MMSIIFIYLKSSFYSVVGSWCENHRNLNDFVRHQCSSFAQLIFCYRKQIIESSLCYHKSVFVLLSDLNLREEHNLLKQQSSANEVYERPAHDYCTGTSGEGLTQ